MTVKDVILTVTLMLGAGLCARLVADFLRLPHMLVLLGTGVLLGSSVSGAIDVSLDSMGSQLVLTLGVSFILFHGGLQLSLGILRKVAIGLRWGRPARTGRPARAPGCSPGRRRP